MNFFMNSADTLTLGDALVQIRSKQPIDRSIKRVSAPAKVGWKFFVMFLVPGLAAAAGAARVFLRMQAKQTYLKTLALVK